MIETHKFSSTNNITYFYFPFFFNHHSIMDMLDNFLKSGDDKSGHGTDDQNLHHTKSDLIHSAQVLADVASSQLRHEPGKYDKAEVADATANLLNAAAEYGNMDDSKGVGMYVDKAEDYLRHYHNKSHSADHEKSRAAGEHSGDDSSRK